MVCQSANFAVIYKSYKLAMKEILLIWPLNIFLCTQTRQWCAAHVKYHLCKTKEAKDIGNTGVIVTFCMI